MPRSPEFRFLTGFLVSLIVFATPVLLGASKFDAASWDPKSTEATVVFVGLYVSCWIAFFAAVFIGALCARKALNHR